MVSKAGLVCLVLAGVGFGGSGNGAMEVSRNLEFDSLFLEKRETLVLGELLDGFSADEFEFSGGRAVRRVGDDTLIYPGSYAVPYYSLGGHYTLLATEYQANDREWRKVESFRSYGIDGLILIGNLLNGPIFLNLYIKPVNADGLGFAARMNVLGEDMQHYRIRREKSVECFSYFVDESGRVINGTGFDINCP